MSGTALIGHTGFVGGALHRQRHFDAVFNSLDIEAIKGREFAQVICCGVSAVKWRANMEPDADWRGIERLIECLKHVSAGRFVAISTIDVYRDPNGVTEADVPPTDGLHPYGRHRLALESFISNKFPSYTIIRLPALFGRGLKKNALFDLMTGNGTDRIVPNAAFQWYPVRRLSSDLTTIVDAGLHLINITAEPISMAAIRGRFFPKAVMGEPTASPYRYNVRSLNDALLGGRDGYHLDTASEFRAFFPLKS